MDRYKHISFRKEWVITPECAYMLGECEAYVQALTDIPLEPEHRDKLHRISLIKGAQATTAIEGNTLKEEEIKMIEEGWKLPPSKEYLEIEVKNILEVFNMLLDRIVYEDEVRIITPELIKEFHNIIGKNLGQHFDAIPGRFREDSRVVSPYLAPDYRGTPNLIDHLCEWLVREFHYNKGQNFSTAVIEAIVTHVYIEWIHPFGDGNGRTGRLLEFYILIRAGLPSIVSHILSNFYNETRPEYYRQLDNARKKSDLTEFIIYAVRGFRDGLGESLRYIQQSQFSIYWHYYIYQTFADVKYTKKAAFKRKRSLILQIPVEKEQTVDEILTLTPDIAKKYARLNRATILRDLKELQELKLLIKKGNRYLANTMILKEMTPPRRA